MSEFKLDPESMTEVHAQFTEDNCVCEEHELEAILKAQKLTRLAVLQLANQISKGKASQVVMRYYKDRIKHVKSYHQKH